MVVRPLAKAAEVYRDGDVASLHKLAGVVAVLLLDAKAFVLLGMLVIRVRHAGYDVFPRSVPMQAEQRRAGLLEVLGDEDVGRHGGVRVGVKEDFLPDVGSEID